MRKASGRAGVLSALALALALGGYASADELDRNQVAVSLGQAWHDRQACEPASPCNTYFDSFGVAMLFADGSTEPFEHVQRGDMSAHNCIKRAKQYLAKGDHKRAVEWAMASQSSAGVRDWMRDHPDEVLELLRGCC